MSAPTSEVAWLRAEIARVEREGIDRALEALAQGNGRPEIHEPARVVALAELALSHGHAVALEADLIRRGAA